MFNFIKQKFNQLLTKRYIRASGPVNFILGVEAILEDEVDISVFLVILL